MTRDLWCSPPAVDSWRGCGEARLLVSYLDITTLFVCIKGGLKISQ